MAIFDSNNAFERDAFSKRDPRDERIRAQVEAVKPAAIDAATQALAVLALLPDAFIRSQKRELARVMRTDKDEKSPRVAALKQSIEQAGTLAETSQRGLARVARLSTEPDQDTPVFQGFVSDAELRPMAGVRVQVSDSQTTDGKPSSAVTAGDGYFCIPLSGDRNTRGTATAGGLAEALNRAFATPAKVDAKNAKVKAEAAAAAAATPQQRTGRVEIFDAGGKLLHEDPLPLPLDAGGLYREYMIGGTLDSKPGKGGAFGSSDIFGAGAGSAGGTTAKPARTTTRGTKTTATDSAKKQTLPKTPDQKAASTTAADPTVSKAIPPASSRSGKKP